MSSPEFSITNGVQAGFTFGLLMTSAIVGGLGITGRISPSLMGKISFGVAFPTILANSMGATFACLSRRDFDSKEDAFIKWHILEISVIATVMAMTISTMSRLTIRGVLSSQQLGYGMLGTWLSGTGVCFLGSVIKQKCCDN